MIEMILGLLLVAAWWTGVATSYTLGGWIHLVLVAGLVGIAIPVAQRLAGDAGRRGSGDRQESEASGPDAMSMWRERRASRP